MYHTDEIRQATAVLGAFIVTARKGSFTGSKRYFKGQVMAVMKDTPSGGSKCIGRFRYLGTNGWGESGESWEPLGSSVVSRACMSLRLGAC